MISRMMTSLLFVCLVVIILLSACGPSQAEIDASPTRTAATMFATQTAEPPTSIPATMFAAQTAEAPTSIPATALPTPTLEPLPGAMPEGIVINYTENVGCTVSGPSELPTGEYTFFVRSEIFPTIYLAYLIDGGTFQDLLDIQVRPGRYWPKPDWVVYAEIVDEWRNDARNERYSTYSLVEGEIVVYLGKNINRVAYLWFCAPISIK